jgi:hypothetical protein
MLFFYEGKALRKGVQKLNFTRNSAAPSCGRMYFQTLQRRRCKASIWHLLTCTAPALFAASFDQNAINGLRFNSSIRMSNPTGRLLIVETQA